MAKRILKVTAPTPATQSGMRGVDLMLQDTTTQQISHLHVEVDELFWANATEWQAAICDADPTIEGCP